MKNDSWASRNPNWIIRGQHKSRKCALCISRELSLNDGDGEAGRVR